MVSVVVPVYNCQTYIEDCLRSIIEQDYPALQVIVVDDGSTDRTAEIVGSFGDRVELHRQSNSGSAVARNLGVSLARGEFIAFNDSDDLWAPNRLKQQVEYLRSQGTYAAVCGRFMAVPADFSLADARKQAPDALPVVDDEKSGWTYLRLLETSIYHIDTLMVRREVMASIRFNPDYRRGQDFDFWLQLVHATPIAQLKNLYAFYRQNPEGITRRPFPRNFRVEIIESALQRYGRSDQLGREISTEQLERILGVSWFGHGYELYRARWFRKALESFLRSMRHDPRRFGTYKYAILSWLRRMQDETPPHVVRR
jgi:glycosyltransferase involved in cell wall biosynthesis